MESLEEETSDFISKFSDVLNAGALECAEEFSEINLCSGLTKCILCTRTWLHIQVNICFLSTCCRLVPGTDCVGKIGICLFE